MALVKNGPHPNAARLFINWMLSEEGQRFMADQGRTPARKGIPSREPEADLTGVKILTVEFDGSNREEATERFRDLIAAALVVPKARKPTKPSRAARAARLEAKRRRAALKRERRAPRGGRDRE